MTWRGPTKDVPFPTLGFVVADWIEDHCAIPDGPKAGEPFVLTDEQLRFVCHHYRLHLAASPTSWKRAFVYRRSQLVRPQKWGKGPLSAALVCAEAQGPVLFAGWDDDGEPAGRPWDTPHIQITAVSEDQTDNVWRCLLPMIELGDFAGVIDDTGLTRINLPDGGLIEPTTASGKSRLGQRITFAVQDETHSWLKVNGGHRLADTQRRNLAGMGGRSVETTNGWDRLEESVAQLTAIADAADVYRDHRMPSAELDFTKPRERIRAIEQAYGDSLEKKGGWVDPVRISAEAAELIGKGEIAQAERFFANRIEVAADAWMTDEEWDDCVMSPPEKLRSREKVCLGFDGSDVDDATALVGSRVSDGYLFVLGVWQRPGGAAREGWRVPRSEVDARVAEAFRRFKVVRFYCDPPFWQDEVAGWAGEFGDNVVKEWWTNREKPMAAALERLQTAVATAGVRHDGDPTLRRHVLNARKTGVRAGYFIQKDRPGSPNKIDAAMAATLAYEARADALAGGEGRRRGGGGGRI